MPKVSKETAANVDDHGIVEDRHEDFDGHTIQFLSFRQDADGTPLMKGLPNDMCHSPHWGYMLKGRVMMRTEGGEEFYAAGQVFYWPPGHAPVALEDSEYVDFSPTEEFAKVIRHLTGGT